MKVNTFTRTVKVSISNVEVFDIFIRTIYDSARISTSKERTLYRAFGYLVGISDKEAVKAANNDAEKEDHITVTGFRKWLPTVFAEFARTMLEPEENANVIAKRRR